MDYKERLSQFESILSTKNVNKDPIIDLYKFRHLCFRGIPDIPGIRQKSWKVLLGYLPTDKRKWSQVLAEQRATYYSFVRDLLADPYEEYGSSGQDDHPLNPAPNSKWAEYFADNVILEQIDKDVRRTLPDLAFFQSPVPQSPLSPLSPRLVPLTINRANGAQSPSIFDALDLINDDVSSVLSRDSDTVVGFTGLGTDGIATLGMTQSNGTSSSLTSETTATSEIASPRSPRRPTAIDVDVAAAVPVMPIPTRRSIFKRVQHLNKEFGTRDKRPDSPGTVNDSCDDGIVDLHWEAIERILFIYAKLNPGIGYVQGMNEILGPIYYTMANDDDEEGKAHAEADAFFVFTLLMADIRDHFVRTLDSDDLNGINATMSRLNKRLKLYARDQWEDMERKSLLPTYYAFRWLTVLCAQEFALPEVIRLWDSVFADRSVGEGGFEFLLDFCCAMVICIKDELLDGSFADNIKLLQNYPIQDPTIVLQKAYGLREARLLAQLNGDSDVSSEEEDYVPVSQNARYNNNNDDSWLSFSPRGTFANTAFFKRPQNSDETQRNAFTFNFKNDSSPSISVQQRMHNVAGETRNKASVLLRKMKGAVSNVPATGIGAVPSKNTPRPAGRFFAWKRNFTPTPS